MSGSVGVDSSQQFHGRIPDALEGTGLSAYSAAQDAAMRMNSEVARLAACPDCGSHQGRHLRHCPRRPAA